MARLPYFPLYVNDWLGSTTITTLTPEQEGGFIRLLCHAWSSPDCTIPGDEQELMALSRLSSQALAKLLAKAWLPCKLGYYNAKLRVVKEAYEAHSKAMSEAGKKGAKAKKELKLQEKEPIAKLQPSFSKASAKDKLSLASALAFASSSSNSSLSASEPKEPLSGKPDFEGVISYLNQKTNQNYRATGKGTKKLITARWNEGFRLDDFKKAIDNMAAKWLTDPKMSQYLRPITLFGEKFESYLNAKVTLSDKGIVSQKTEKSIAVGQQWLRKHQVQEGS